MLFVVKYIPSRTGRKMTVRFAWDRLLLVKIMIVCFRRDRPLSTGPTIFMINVGQKIISRQAIQDNYESLSQMPASKGMKVDG